MRRFGRMVTLMLTMPVLLGEYFRRSTGREYRIGFCTKLVLVLKMARNNLRVTSASTFVEHLVMATRIMQVPRAVPGVVVECGTYQGGSAVNLSLMCALCGRRLQLFDSFAGLPEPSETDKHHTLLDCSKVHTYARGAFLGTLETVRSNLARYGVEAACDYHVGFFDQTIPNFKEPCVLLFLDVDLVDSLKTCLRHLWPLLQEGGYLFTHEASHLEVAALFFDKQWWQENLQSAFPGLVGAGNGLGLYPRSGGFSSSLGYTVKHPRRKECREVPQTGE